MVGFCGYEDKHKSSITANNFLARLITTKILYLETELLLLLLLLQIFSMTSCILDTLFTRQFTFFKRLNKFSVY
jgi:hypothetical protein